MKKSRALIKIRGDARLAIPRPEKALLPIAGIGASAGGLEAFTSLLRHLPANSGMAFVLVQHLDPVHESALAEILARSTSMPVREVSDRMLLQPNNVYVIPPDARLTVSRGYLRLRRRQSTGGVQHPIDELFESLARDQQERAIGVVLSGTATDGTLGLEAIKAGGGVTFAQDESAKYDSMPRSAIAADCVDFVLPPEKIAERLAQIAKHPCVIGTQAVPSDQRQSGSSQETSRSLPDDSAFKRILLLLRNRCSVDFSLYKPSTIQRRIRRRMVLNKCETLEAYATFLRGNAKELDDLYSDVLINVTGFFRTPDAFKVLKRDVFPKLLQKRRREEPIRVWIAGCSTGQEAYSIAMALLESAESTSRSPKLQVFATDLNETLLEKARQGLYPESLVQGVSPERLRRFFVAEKGGFRVNKSLRDVCVFARHNLLADPPFSRMDLISCRNLLIYIEQDSQNRVMPTLHYALKPEGFLFLGASESIGQLNALFKPVDRKTRIFTRKSATASTLPTLPSRPEGRSPGVRTGKSVEAPKSEATALREADRVMASRYTPPSVLIDEDLQILQSRGATGSYLSLAAGKASLDLLKMARGRLMLPLRTAIHKAKKQGKAVRVDNVNLGLKGDGAKVNIEVVPLRNLKERFYLVFFEDAEHARSAPPPAPTTAEAAAGEPRSTTAWRKRVADLERELEETREYLQSIQEQNEATNEELQASNEEVTSANEELQSINEELETSKEELESSNEELTTINEEMANRNQELNRLNADLNNLHLSINTPILVLARNLTIRYFTPLAEKVFNLLGADVGRPLSGIKHNLTFTGLEELITETIASNTPRECEIQDKSGNWYMLRVRPYLSLDNVVDGAVVMLVDINALKQTEENIRRAQLFAQAVIDSVPPLLILGSDLRVCSANPAFYATFGVSAGQTDGKLIYELGNAQWNIPALRTLLEEILPRNKSFRQYEVTHEFETIGRRTMLISGCRADTMQAIVLSIEDITARKEAEEILRHSKEDVVRHAEGLEQVVQERTAALRETVAELEHFSYSIIHDMRAPLRAMQGFATMLEAEGLGNRSKQSAEYLRRIKMAAERLDRLITDILSYSKVLLSNQPLQPVEVAKLLHEITEIYPNLNPNVADIKVEFDRLVVLGNDPALGQCFSNLLTNSLKFVAPGVKPQVRIWAEDKGARVRIWVVDNGIGIPKESHEKIFSMFQRMHTESEYPGTGIGLAIARKVIHRLGGQVGVESEPGKGSSFWIELAKPDEARPATSNSKGDA